MRNLAFGIFFAVTLLGCGHEAVKTESTGLPTDRQCGQFCADLDRCIGSDYGGKMVSRLCDLARCESGCRTHATAPAGYEGPFQFDRKTWTSVCGPIFDRASRPECKSDSKRKDLCCAAQCTAEVVAKTGMSRWPNCGN